MNNFTLKLIAITTMLIDHVGAVLFPQYLWIRVIGRLSFPIFCFLIIEGFYHTRDVNKYLTRLGIFALISEIPFNLAFYNNPTYNKHQNIFFTLFIGLGVVYLMDMVRKRFEKNFVISNILDAIILIAGCSIAILLNTDYTLVGILLIVAFYLFRENKIIRVIAVIVITGLLGPIELFASFALIPIAFYNGKKGPSMKYVFYLFYPVHLLCLYFIANYLI